jgi:lipopolysaccharide/colanic/teichoic acid biosynthesis glycosyltransferase
MRGWGRCECALCLSGYAGIRPKREQGIWGIQMAQTDVLLSARQSDRVRVYLGVKRVMDYLVCVPLLIFSLPLMLFVAAAIYACSPGPALFRQERDGHLGRKFRVLKFRTMHLDADKRLETCLAENPEMAQEWARCFKLRNDPRLIGFLGKFLRSSCLDELPQLFNVLAGDMTLVGPRPFPSYHLTAFDPAFRRLRSSVMPGLTGLWQVERRDNDLDNQIRLDSYYINNLSLKLDAYILYRTALTVVTLRNG